MRFFIARSVGAAAFGAFSLAFATYALTITAARAVGTEPLLIRYSGGLEDSWRRGTRLATGSSLLFGCLAGAGCLLAAVGLGGELRPAFIVLGIMLPGLLLQDSWRFVFVAAGRSHVAFVNDLFWGIFLAPGLVLLLLWGSPSIWEFILVWGGTGGAAAAFGLLQARLVPQPLRAPAWWREHRDLAPRFLGEVAAETAADQVSLFSIAALAGIGAVGSMQAAFLLLAPLHVLFLGVGLFAIPEGVRLARRSFRHLRMGAALLSAGLVAAVLAWGGVLLLLPTEAGVGILGPVWIDARSILLPVTLSMAALGARTGPIVVLRVLADARRSLRARLAASGLTVAGSILGAGIAGLEGAVWGHATAAWLGAAVWWWQSRGRGDPIPAAGNDRRSEGTETAGNDATALGQDG
ncbi:MAG: hypothetical protein ACRDH6_07335 [Actinomycetota bacterium]